MVLKCRIFGHKLKEIYKVKTTDSHTYHSSSFSGGGSLDKDDAVTTENLTCIMCERCGEIFEFKK